METQNLKQQSATFTRQHITVKKKLSLEEYKEIVYLTRNYYDAMRHKKDLPTKSLPSLEIMIEASTIVNAYLEGINIGLIAKLYNACLPVETVVAVYLFANEPTLNVRIGNYQLLALNHHADR